MLNSFGAQQTIQGLSIPRCPLESSVPEASPPTPIVLLKFEYSNKKIKQRKKLNIVQYIIIRRKVTWKQKEAEIFPRTDRLSVHFIVQGLSQV